jgi:hypothetical protein
MMKIECQLCQGENLEYKLNPDTNQHELVKNCPECDSTQEIDLIEKLDVEFDQLMEVLVSIDERLQSYQLSKWERSKALRIFFREAKKAV